MTKHFNPFGNKAVTMNFKCDDCSYDVSSNDIGIPEIDSSAESYRDSYNDNSDLAICDNCLKVYNIKVWKSSAGGYVEIDINNQQNNSFSIIQIKEDRDLIQDKLEDLIELDAEYFRELYEAIKLET